MNGRGWAMLVTGLVAAFGLAFASRSPSSSSPPLGANDAAAWRTFTTRLLMFASQDAAQPIVETGGHNRGPEIDQYLAELGQAPGQNWCAAWLHDVIERARAGLNVALQITRSAAAKVTGRSMPRQVTKSAAGPSSIPPASVVYWDRSQPGNPDTEWWGHIGFVVQWTGPRTFTTIEGNSGPTGDRVATMTRSLDDPRLLGFGLWPG